jgi:diguanylate cyclase (GGDEF)-like protein
VQTAFAAAVFHVLLGHAHATSIRAMGVALLASLVADIVSAVSVTWAIACFRGAWPDMDWWALGAGLVASCGKTSLALLAVRAITEHAPFELGMIAICAAVMFYAFHAYAGLHERHRRLEKLYRFNRAVGGSVQLDEIARAIVTEARELLHAGTAELRLAGTPDEIISWTCDGAEIASTRVPRQSDDDAGPQLDASDDALAVPLVTHAGVIGRLVVAQPLGVDRRFDQIDARLFEALAGHAAIALENGGLVEQLQIEMREREHRAAHDPLTGLANRLHFNELVDATLAHGGEHVLFLLGLDRFSDVNETLGHDNGDVVLCEVGQRLRGAIPDSIVSRLGSDEFAVFASVDADTAPDALRDKLVAAVVPGLTIDGLQLEIGVSIGVALAPEHASEALALLRCADTAMRDAKERRLGFAIYEPGSEVDTRRRLTLAHQLRHAIDHGELVLWYQPQLAIATGEVTGVEALVRWNHPELGLLPPDEFIPIAEHVGLIDALTARVLDDALRQRRVWADLGRHLDVAVNISARSLTDTLFADRITRALVRHRCPVDALTLEITESQIMADPERAAAALGELHDLGVRIAIDDFGTGFSSLASLRALPVDELKIDKSFVFGVPDSPSDSAIVRSTAALGQSLGLHVVAEGVENEHALEFLVGCGVDTAQGYYFSRPVPAPELDVFLGARELRRPRLTA